MKKHIFCFIIVIFFSGKLFASVDDCSAFFIKKGVAAGFPLMKKRNVWEWYKKFVLNTSGWPRQGFMLIRNSLGMVLDLH